MAKLTSEARKEIPTGKFALPGKRAYPIEDASHARAALSMDHNATPSERKTIESKVHEKYPSIGGDHKKAVMGMNHEHVHKLVTDAHAGKYGPQAQQVAQMATQPQQSATPQQGDGDADDTGGSSPSSMFSSGGASPAAAAPPQPASRASMFQGR